MKITKQDLQKPQNILSLIRIPLSFLMLGLVFYDKWVFLIVLILIGLTDFFDGIIARRRGEESQKGAWFDSMADHIFYPLLFISSYFLGKELFTEFKTPIILLLTWWIINFLIMIIRTKKIQFIHLQTVRLSVFAYFVLTILLVINKIPKIALTITLILFAIRGAEETIVFSLINPKKINPDLKWFWQMKTK